jgi:hypothetical protein
MTNQPFRHIARMASPGFSSFPRPLKIRIEAMPQTFKQWTPATAELELLHECWLARLPPAKIAVRSQFEFQLSTHC